MAPTLPKDEEPSSNNSRNNKQPANGTNGVPLQAARRGLLKAIWDASFGPRFSSKPIDMEDYFSRESFATPNGNSANFSSLTVDNNNSAEDNNSAISPGSETGFRTSLVASKNLTPMEQNFLENLLQSEDLNSIRKASERLADKDLFPPAPIINDGDETISSVSDRILKRRESDVQQELYRLHQRTSVKPSSVLQRMTSIEKKKATSRAKQATASTPLIPELAQSNSILTAKDDESSAPKRRAERATASTPLIPPLAQSNSILGSTHDATSPYTIRVGRSTASTPLIPPLAQSNSILMSATSPPTSPRTKPTAVVKEVENENVGSWDMDSDNDEEKEMKYEPNDQKDKEDTKPAKEPSDGKDGDGRPKRIETAWNPFGDVNSWIDGNQGVEVDGEGIPSIPSPTSNPFKILGTSADDVSAHPHVLTPPLMEGLQQFMPESLHEYHFWLKYSLVRDAPTSVSPSNPPLLDMLRHCRASFYTVLAVETTEGHVFGAFCSQPWRLYGEKYWGSKDSFVWRMRRSRNDTCDSIVEKVLMESKIDVFPFTGGNTKIQQCSETDGMVLGEGEVSDLSSKQQEGDHYGNAIRLDPTMNEAWTSTCETFGNPCLAHTDRRGEKVQIANVELWSLTPHQSIESAITSEMKDLFLAENNGPAEKNLDLFEILVGGPV
jgi:hypothetical protein